jgi:hypothetical protein
MKSREIPLAALAMPDLKGFAPLMDVVTADIAYIRLYGGKVQPWIVRRGGTGRGGAGHGPGGGGTESQTPPA